MARETTLKGKKLMLFLDDKVVALSTSCDLSINASYTAGATKDDGLYQDQTLESIDYSITNNALMCENDATTKMSYQQLLTKQLAGTEIEFAVCIPANWANTGVPTDGWSDTSATVLVSGKCKVQSLQISAPANGDATVNATLVGSGKLTVGA